MINNSSTPVSSCTSSFPELHIKTPVSKLMLLCTIPHGHHVANVELKKLQSNSETTSTCIQCTLNEKKKYQCSIEIKLFRTCIIQSFLTESWVTKDPRHALKGYYDLSNWDASALSFSLQLIGLCCMPPFHSQPQKVSQKL